MKNTSRIWRLIAAVAFVATIAACSDGELTFGAGPNITPPPPVILKFEANPPQVAPGGSTVLSWEVEDADAVEISTSADGIFQFHMEPTEETKSSTTVPGITDTTDFTITAYKTVLVASSPEGDENVIPDENGEEGEEGAVEEEEDIAPEAALIIARSGQIPIPAPIPEPSTTPQTVTASATITVTVVAASELTADITADKSTINSGESTVIRWTVTPSDAEVTVSASNSEAVVAAADCTDVSGELDNYPAEGCAQVSPERTTTYTVRATDINSGDEVEDAVTINVVSADVEAKIMADGEDNLRTITDPSTPVHITYTVNPSEAMVTISADKPVECTPELPTSEVAASELPSDGYQCTVSEETRFSIEARAGEAYDDDEVAVAVQIGQIGDAVFKAQPWAFEGETVTVTADPEGIAGSSRSAIKEIKIAGTSFTMPATGVLEAEVVVPAAGVDAYVLSNSGVKIEHKQIVKAVSPVVFSIGDNTTEFSRIAFDANETSRAMIGVKKRGYNGGIVNAYKVNVRDVNDYSEWNIDIGEILLATAQSDAYWNRDGLGFFEMVHDYPVSAITTDSATGRVFIGTTGALVYSDNANSTDEEIKWEKVSTLLRFNTEDHKTCFGEIQPGNGDTLGSLGRVCDIVARDDSLIAAYDRGVITFKNVDTFLETQSADQLAGRPPAGEFSESEYPLYAAVSHDLEAVEGVIFAASEKGLYKSEDNGVTWTKIEGVDEEIFAVAVDELDEKIYVGTETSIMFRDLSGGSWTTKNIGQKVYSIDNDPYQAGVILAGTSQGIYISRDKGEKFLPINVAGFEEKAIKSVAIAAEPNGSEHVTYSISFAGEGAAVASVTVEKPDAESGDDDGSDDATEEEDDTIPTIPDDDTGDDTVEDDGTIPAAPPVEYQLSQPTYTFMSPSS